MKFEYDPARHYIPHGMELASFLKRRFPQWDIFVYHDRLTGRWAVAEWRVRWQWIETLHVIGTNYHEFTAQDVKNLDYLLNGPTIDPIRFMKSFQRGVHKEDMDLNAEEADADRFVQRRLGDDRRGTPSVVGNF